MGKVMIIDLALCNGCHNCQVACKDEHCANDWSPIARPQPDTGQFWNKVVHLERGSFPKVQVTYHHTICQHCEDAPCLAACPSNAIYRRDDGIVIIDPGKCCGNKMCIAACPYEGVIFFNEHLNMAQKCTFCAHLLDRGWAEPRCSDACPTGAFTFGDDSDPATAAKMAAAELLKPELATRPRVYYLNLPKRWIAGAVYDPAADEVTKGATVTATNAATGASVTTATDHFGDFWLKDLAEGSYTLVVEKDGYGPERIGPVDVAETDRNLGDIALSSTGSK
jgi:tetrathionate reductase subunit B